MAKGNNIPIECIFKPLLILLSTLALCSVPVIRFIKSTNVSSDFKINQTHSNAVDDHLKIAHDKDIVVRTFKAVYSICSSQKF